MTDRQTDVLDAKQVSMTIRTERMEDDLSVSQSVSQSVSEVSEVSQVT